MFPFNAIFSVFAPAGEPVVENDDTQEVPVLSLHTKPIDVSELHGVSQLEKALVDYQPFETDDVWTLGHIVEATLRDGQVWVLVEAVSSMNHSIQPKWRNLSIHNVEWAWYE